MDEDRLLSILLVCSFTRKPWSTIVSYCIFPSHFQSSWCLFGCSEPEVCLPDISRQQPILKADWMAAQSVCFEESIAIPAGRIWNEEQLWGLIVCEWWVLIWILTPWVGSCYNNTNWISIESWVWISSTREYKETQESSTQNSKNSEYFAI